MSMELSIQELEVTIMGLGLAEELLYAKAQQETNRNKLMDWNTEASRISTMKNKYQAAYRVAIKQAELSRTDTG